MSPPDPVPAVITEEMVYEALPYHFDREHDEPSTVVRIPVAGPAPFNTLAYFRWRVPIGPGHVSDGKHHSLRETVPTPLVIRDYIPEDPDRSSILHSSIGWISIMQITAEGGILADGGTAFTTAVDLVFGDAKIDATGRVAITVETASQAQDVYAGTFANISTWALITETRKVVEGWEVLKHLKFPP